MEIALDRHWGSSDQDRWHSSPAHKVEDHIVEVVGRRFVSEFLIRQGRSGIVENAGMNQQEDQSISDAIASLDNITSDAQDMGYTVPEAAVVAEARRILLEMHDYRSASYDAYSMSDGRVGIGVDGEFGKSMLVVCEPGGTALCVVTANRVSRHARYGDSSFLPDDFVKQGLRQVSPSPLSVGVRHHSPV